MKLTVYPSAHGDCLMLESGGERMLIDGGLDGSFKNRVLPMLAETADRPIDCVYLSHIDFDHVGGLLVLLDALFQWRVYDYRTENGKHAVEPALPRPPEILKIWHNGFAEMFPENAVPISSALANTAAILAGLDGKSADAATEEVVRYHRDLATHTGHALQLSYRIGGNQLGIPLNPEFGGELMQWREDAETPELTLGDATFTLLGPTEKELDELKAEWDEWLDAVKNEKAVKEIERTRRKDDDALTNAAEAFIQPLEMEARALAGALSTPGLAAKAEDLGKRGKVTAPNLASLMFLVEEGKKKILLTGDGHADDVIKGLEAHGKLSSRGKLHVNVLKVPHHGAEYNMTPEFARDITADHYVFCGNGYATNPEVIVLETIVAERASGKKGKYKFWFNCDPETASHKKQMRLVRETVERLEGESGGRLSYEFIDDAFEVPV